MPNNLTCAPTSIARSNCATADPDAQVVVKTIGPSNTSDWNTYVARHANATLFHTIAWRDAVKEAFGHEDIYLAAFRHDRIVGVLPIFFVNSRIGGRMLVSVPYGVGGGVIADDDRAAAALFDAAKSEAVERTCTTIDLRSERASVPGIPIIDRYVGFRKTLPSRPEDVLAWLPRKARAAARNARNKFHLEVSVGDENLKDLWRLYTQSMRRLASLPYPFRFFESLANHTPDAHSVLLVRRNGRPVAGLMTFEFRGTVLPYFIGTAPEAKRCSAANFIYLTAMERGVSDGCRIFDFGRSRRENVGSFDFKRFNGFTPRPLEYQMYVTPGAKSPNLSPSNPKFRFARAVWRHLPLSVTRAVGTRLAREIPG